MISALKYLSCYVLQILSSLLRFSPCKIFNYRFCNSIYFLIFSFTEMNLSDEFVQPESFDKSYYDYLEMKEQSEREKDEDQLLLLIQIGNDAAHTILT